MSEQCERGGDFCRVCAEFAPVGFEDAGGPVCEDCTVRGFAHLLPGDVKRERRPWWSDVIALILLVIITVLALAVSG